MEVLTNLGLGFSVAFSVTNLLACFAGALLGTLIGVLPGIGPVATIAMLLPITFGMEPVTALIMLAGIYYGAQYGGSTTAILINLPGESSSVITALDGYQMARQGRAGIALGIAAIGSFIAGCFATLVIAIAGPALSGVATSFASPEYFCLMLLGLIAAISIGSGSIAKSVCMIFLGMLLGLVGTDVYSGYARLSFGILQLSSGFDFVPLALGLFGISEIILNLQHPEHRQIVSRRLNRIWPSREHFRQSQYPILRGTLLGSVLGLLPGGGALLGSFASYMTEKKLSLTPERFGHGAIEGVAGPEAANNAGAQTSFIPLLTLGIPSNAVMALMMGAMILHGIVPGPNILTQRPELFWGMTASMWIGNLMLLVINLPLIGLWVRLLTIPYSLLYPAIIAFACIGVFSVSYEVFDVAMVVAFGLLGYIFVKLQCPPAPLVLGFVLGPLMEENLRRSMQIADGSLFIFLERPICATLVGLACLLVALATMPLISRQRQKLETP
jgi:putative tricarboxylic transport membrane protein